MKRGGYLQRRTELHSSPSLLRGSGLNPTSAKRAKQNRERSKALAPLRAAQPWCSRCGVTGVGLDAHELVRRSQYAGAANDLDVIVLLCRDCHRFATEQPQAAHDEGWVIWGWEHREAAK